MITFLVCFAILALGYKYYGGFISRILNYDDSIQTPASKLADGVDFQEMPWWKVLLTQFLNIAGLGPIFGAISGAMFGPVAFLWITFGSILIGATHDLLSGYISLKHEGQSYSEIVGIYMGKNVRLAMRIFTFVLLILVATVFTANPAAYLATLNDWPVHIWIYIIMAYYLIATVLPINVLIAKIFPALSLVLIAMGVMLFISLLIGQFSGNLVMQEFTFAYSHPGGLAVFPFLFITIACGAISGFHSIKSPMMARCVKKESESKPIFFGAMIVEGMIALIWAAVAMAIFGQRFWTDGLALPQIEGVGGPLGAVAYASYELLGALGPVATLLIIIAVVIFPVTTGDTTFRSVRLMVADITKSDQSKIINRLIVCAPIFAISIALTYIDFDILWRYFAWSNQTLGALVLWTGAVFLIVNNRTHWIASLPATFLTFISISYILQAPEGFQLSPMIGNSVGIVVAVVVLIAVLASKTKIEGAGLPQTLTKIEKR